MTLIDIENMMHVGSAITYVNAYHRQDLEEGNLFEKDATLAEFIYSLNLIGSDGKLTSLGNQVFACPDLINYYDQVQYDLKEPRQEDAKVSPMKYRVLRSGLGQRFKYFACEYLNFIKSFMSVEPKYIADVGGGSGDYLKLLCESFKCKGDLYDKSVQEAEDNLDIKNPQFMTYIFNVLSQKKLFGQYDIILLNEVLHLTDDDSVRENIVRLCIDSLVPGGWLVIGENHPSPSMDWRLSRLSNGSTLVPAQIDSIFHKLEELLNIKIKVLEIPTHYYLAVQKRSY